MVRFAPLVDHQVARNGKQPRLKPRLPVELPATHQHPHPDFLKQVLGHLPVAGEKEQIAQQPVLVADDQLVQQPRILPLEPFGDSKVLLPHLLFGTRDSSRSKQRTYGRNSAHLFQLDVKSLSQAA